MAIAAYLQGPDLGHYAVYHHDTVEDLKRIKAPAMIVSDVDDSLHPADMRAAKLRPDFAYKEHASGAMISMRDGPEWWAKTAADFVKKAVK